ncbi:MAG: DUF5615 family PIN-like protein [Acidimicrobiaceae bacterium]|nr:DUF5615 family PIN-like protein [Acidimicrobiaceae bacterium]
MRFCLDANLSFRVAEAIDPNVADVIHVSRVAALASSARGRSDASDEDVARWCAANERVLVTCDDDFRGRRARTSGLTELGLEVIMFVAQLRGLQYQIDTIARRVTAWQDHLGVLLYGPRTWIQYSRGRPRLQR